MDMHIAKHINILQISLVKCDKLIIYQNFPIKMLTLYTTGGGTRGHVGSCPHKFTNAHRKLVFHNRNVSC